MPYVERDGNGDITGVFNVKQPSIAEELLADNDPEIVAFRTPPPPPPKSAATLTAEELATQMIKDGTMTQAKIEAIKAAR